MPKPPRKALNIGQYFDQPTAGSDELDFLLGAGAAPSPPTAGDESPDDRTESAGTVQQLAVAAIAPDLQQLRRLPLPPVLQHMAAAGDRAAQAQLASLDDLGASMQQHGQFHPVIVYATHDPTTPQITHRLLNGQRRWSAAQLAGLPTLLALVVPEPRPVERLLRQYEENERRQDFSDMERAVGLMTLKATLAADTGADVPWRVVEAQLHLSESRRKDLLRLLRLPATAQDLVMRYGWSEWTLRPLLTALQAGSVSADASVLLVQHLAEVDVVTAPVVDRMLAELTAPASPGSHAVTVSFQTNPDPLRRLTRFRRYLDQLPDVLRAADPTVRSRLHTEVAELLTELTALQEALRHGLPATDQDDGDR